MSTAAKFLDDRPRQPGRRPGAPGRQQGREREDHPISLPAAAKQELFEAFLKRGNNVVLRFEDQAIGLRLIELRRQGKSRQEVRSILAREFQSRKQRRETI